MEPSSQIERKGEVETQYFRVTLAINDELILYHSKSVGLDECGDLT